MVKLKRILDLLAFAAWKFKQDPNAMALAPGREYVFRQRDNPGEVPVEIIVRIVKQGRLEFIEDGGQDDDT